MCIYCRVYDKDGLYLYASVLIVLLEARLIFHSVSHLFIVNIKALAFKVHGDYGEYMVL